MSDDGAKEWVTVKVPKADKQQADEYRPEGSTFGDCLVAGAERLNDHLDSDTARFGDGVDAETLAEDIKDELSMANEPGVEVDVDRLINRIEDLESRLPGKVADELEGRMR